MPKLSATMAICLGETIDRGGKLIRHVGGRWAYPNCPRRWDGYPEEWFNSSTVEALVARDEMEYVEWREGKKGNFPIAAQVKAKVDGHA